jgi:hypothetical protein
MKYLKNSQQINYATGHDLVIHTSIEIETLQVFFKESPGARVAVVCR